jgi:Rrf2 family protein
MKMSEGVEWAAHCAVLLALLPAGASLPAHRLAEYHDVPGPYLAKSLQAMTRAGIVTSSAGRHGGYRLARPGNKISLLEVVVAIEGDDPMFRCSEIRRRGPSAVSARAYTPRCGIATAMGRAQEAWRTELERTTVADLAAGVLADAPRKAMDKGVTWLTSVIETRSPSAS